MKMTLPNIKNLFKDNMDFKTYTVYAGKNNAVKCMIMYFDGICSIKEHDTLLTASLNILDFTDNDDTARLIKNSVLINYMPEVITDINILKKQLLEGCGILFLCEENRAVSWNFRKAEKRAISESSSETIIKGGKDCFNENLAINTALIRSRIKSEKLKLVALEAGKKYPSKICIAYIDGTAEQDTVEKIREVIQNIDIDGVVSIGVIEEHFVRTKLKVFPQTMYSERSDKICANIVEGKIAILVEGYPIALVLPVTLNMLMQAPEDYTINHIFASFLRIIRYAAMMLSLLLPAYYIAVMSFNQDMLPVKLAITIIQSKAAVPFSSIFELLLIMTAFEIFIEASTRVPKTIGSVVSIIGALIVGEAAVRAGLMSPSVIIVVAAAGITGFAIPNTDVHNAVRIWRAIIVLMAVFAGLYGIVLGLVLFLSSITRIEVYNKDYAYPFTPNGKSFLNSDSFFRNLWNKRAK